MPAFFAPPLLFFLLILRLPPSSTYSDYRSFQTVCSSSSYNSTSAYASALHRLLSNITTSVIQFPSFSTAVSDDPSSRIFGLAQRRPNSDADICSYCITKCMNTMLTSISDGCPLRRSATLRYEDCLLRYSDQTFFGSGSGQKWSVFMNTRRSVNPAAFKQRATAFMSELAVNAAKDKDRFAVGQLNSAVKAEAESIYGMAWCTMDLPSETCLNCLTQGMGEVDFEKTGAQVFGISCALRFEISPIYTAAPSAGGVPGVTASSSAGQPVSAAGMRGKSPTLRRTGLLISITFAAALVLI